MFEKIFSFFIPKEKLEELNSYEKVRYLSRAQLLILLTLVTILTTNALFIFQTIVLSYDIIDGSVIPFSTSFLLIGLWLIKKTGKVVFLSWIIFLLILFVLPARIYYMGGPYNANNLSWFVSCLLIVGAVHSRKVVVFYIFCSITSVIILSSITISPYSSPQFAKVINFLLAYFTAALSLGSIFRVKQYILKETKKIEKVTAINIMITTMSHEINNPLTIAMGNMEILRYKNIELSEMKAIESSLIRIQEIVKNINSIKGVHDINIEQYLPEREIISFKNKII